MVWVSKLEVLVWIWILVYGFRKDYYFQHTEDDNYVHHRSVRHLHPWKGFTRIPWL